MMVVEQQFATFLLSRIDVKLSALSDDDASQEVQVYVNQLRQLLQTVFDVDDSTPPVTPVRRRRRVTSPDVTTSHTVTT